MNRRTVTKLARCSTAILISVSLILPSFATPVFAAPKNLPPIEIKVNPVKIGEPSEYGYIDSEVDNTQNTLAHAKDKGGIKTLEALPTSYDLRIDQPELSTDVRNQSPWGVCWSFSSLASVESAVIKKGYETSPKPSLSPWHLIWSVYNPFTYAPFDADTVLNTSGGNADFATAAFSKGFGPNDESAYPFETAESPLPNPIATLSTLKDHKYRVTDSNKLPNALDENGEIIESNLNLIKKAIMEHGQLTFSYYVANNYLDDFYDKTNKAWYTPGEIQPNHAVALVGWDDDFDKDNFNDSNEPPENGAYLLKNNWGTGWDDNPDGYFWLSYYDKSASGINYYDVDNLDYKAIAQNDTLGWTGATLAPETGNNIANIYTAPASSPNRPNLIKSIGYYNANANDKVTIEIRENLTDPDDPSSGKLVETIKQTQSYPGYNTASLKNPLYVAAWSKYSITIKYQNSGKITKGVPIEQNVYPGSNFSKDYGESYLYMNQYKSWIDIAAVSQSQPDLGGFPIKVFLDNTSISAKNIKIDSIQNQAYTSKDIILDLKATYNGVALKENRDFDTVYSNNKKIGKATIKISGSWDFSGSKTVKFKIVPPKTTIKSLKIGSKKLTIKWKKPTTITKYQLSYKVQGAKNWKSTTASKNSKSKVIKKLKSDKKYSVRIRSYKLVDGKKYYSAWSKTKTTAKVK